MKVILKIEDYSRIWMENAIFAIEFRELQAYMKVANSKTASMIQGIESENFDVIGALTEIVATQIDINKKIIALNETYTNLCEACLGADENSKQIL